MYTRNDLERYEYFKNILQTDDISLVVDALTGAISRRYIIGFIKDLISKKVPFSLTMIDIDNFKFVNDNYGHAAGDVVLNDISEGLINELKTRGLVGRFGGDEFLFVNLIEIEYNDIKTILNHLYYDGFLRKTVTYENNNIYITATVGCATYPENSTDYDDLFHKIDVTLYRGKSKGRNCYIIYVQEIHGNIEIKAISKERLYSLVRNLMKRFEEAPPDILGRLDAINSVLCGGIRVTNLFYSYTKGHIEDLQGTIKCDKFDDICELLQDDYFITNTIDNIEKAAPNFYAFSRENNLETMMIVRAPIHEEKKQYLYLMCAESSCQRIWQEDEYTLLYICAQLMARYINHEKLL